MRTRPLRRLSSLGRLLVALAVLVGLFFGTRYFIKQFESETDRHREDERVRLTGALADPLRRWLATGRDATAVLASGLGGLDAAGRLDRGVLQEKLGKEEVVAFSSSFLVVDRNLVARGASPERAGMVPRVVADCENAANVVALRSVVDAAYANPAPRVVGVMALPGTCRQGVAVTAVTTEGYVVLLFGDLSEVRSRIAPIEEGEFNTFATTPFAQMVVNQHAEVSALPPRITGFLGENPPEQRLGRYAGEVGPLVGVYQGLEDGWGYVFEESATSFALPETKRPSLRIPLILTAVFALAFALVASFELRRRRALRRADEHRDAFLAVVGHELRTPLTVIKGYTETLASRWDALSDESRHMLISNMAPQTQRQARVIEHLLTAASLQAGTLPPPVIEPTDVAGVLQGVIAEFRPLAPLHAFALDVPADVPLAQADGRTLAQAVGELVDNAVRYSPSGGRVLITAKASGRSIVITVDDEGVGLPASRGNLFEPFVQGEDVDRRLHDEGGIGVGLYIARALVTSMGGTVAAESRKPSGTRLTVTVPADRARRLTPA